jgi:hypothetical protein
MEPTISYLGVKFSAQSVSEVLNGLILASVDKADIQRIELTSGSGAERPALQLILGICLAAFGPFGLIPLLAGNIRLFRYELGFAFFGLIGAWLICETLRRRTFLLVTTHSDRRKLFFHGDIDPAQMAGFLTKAETDFGYTIRAQMPGIFAK